MDFDRAWDGEPICILLKNRIPQNLLDAVRPILQALGSNNTLLGATTWDALVVVKSAMMMSSLDSVRAVA